MEDNSTNMNQLLSIILVLACTLGLATFSSCMSRSQNYLVEYDDVYVTKADLEAEDAARLNAVASGTDSLATQNIKERFKMNPRAKRFLLYTGGALLEMGLNVALVILLYGS